jgi:hypothetical protein
MNGPIGYRHNCVWSCTHQFTRQLGQLFLAAYANIDAEVLALYKAPSG